MTQAHRKHDRIPFEDDVFIKMMQTTNPEKIDEGATILCSILDVSVTGVRLSVPSELPIGSRMEVWVKSKEYEGTLKIKGKVVWCESVEGTPGLQAGIEIRNYEHTDFKEFQKRVVKIILPPSIDEAEEE